MHAIYQQDGVPRARCRILSLYVYKNKERANVIVFTVTMELKLYTGLPHTHGCTGVCACLRMF